MDRWLCSISTVKRRENTGDLTPIKIGRLVRHRLSDVLAYEDRHRSGLQHPEPSLLNARAHLHCRNNGKTSTKPN